MGPEIEVLEERLKSFLCQLQAESGILDRVVYKNKNQHRRCSYFQYLLKVRRDVKLLHSVRLEDLLESCFHIITGRKAKQKAHLLESLKRNKSNAGKFNLLDRLLGAARLLSEMVEPMLKAATEISTLLARSFFTGFSLMVLALLARVRVLVQQMLLDVVSVFNEVSSIAQKKQSTKITQDGVEVFREYYPALEEVVNLECAWKTDEFVLVEKIDKVETRNEGGTLEGGQTLGSSVRYRSIQAFLGDDVLDFEKPDSDTSCKEKDSSVKRKRLESPETVCNKSESSKQVQIPLEAEDNSESLMPPTKKIALSRTSPISTLSKPETVSNKRVAFVSVAKPAPSASVPSTTAKFPVDVSDCNSNGAKENTLFSLFNEEDMKSKSSIF